MVVPARHISPAGFYIDRTRCEIWCALGEGAYLIVIGELREPEEPNHEWTVDKCKGNIQRFQDGHLFRVSCDSGLEQWKYTGRITSLSIYSLYFVYVTCAGSPAQY